MLYKLKNTRGPLAPFCISAASLISYLERDLAICLSTSLSHGCVAPHILRALPTHSNCSPFPPEPLTGVLHPDRFVSLELVGLSGQAATSSRSIRLAFGPFWASTAASAIAWAIPSPMCARYLRRNSSDEVLSERSESESCTVPVS